MKEKSFWCRMLSVFFGALIVYSCSGKDEQKQFVPIKVITEEAHPVSVEQCQSYVGVVEESECTALSFSVSGTIQVVTVKEGEEVRLGTVIATLDRTSAKSALDAAEAALLQARDAYKRMSQLHDSASLPEIKMVEVDSKLQQAQSAYDMARKKYDDGVLRVPFRGVVGKKQLSVGENVMPGQTVCTLLNIDKVKVKIAVPEMEIAGIGCSDSAEIRVPALNGRYFHGRKLEKGVQANPLSHTYDVYVVIDNPSHLLLPGMVCSVGLRPDESRQEVTVPIRAVQGHGNGERFVWSVQEGKAHRVSVVTGKVVGNRMVIHKGLQRGERVIIDGYQKVSEGTKISF